VADAAKNGNPGVRYRADDLFFVERLHAFEGTSPADDYEHVDVQSLGRSYRGDQFADGRRSLDPGIQEADFEAALADVAQEVLHHHAALRRDDADFLDVPGDFPFAGGFEQAFFQEFRPEFVVRLFQGSFPGQFYGKRLERKFPGLQVNVRGSVDDGVHSVLNDKIEGFQRVSENHAADNAGIDGILERKIRMAVGIGLPFRNFSPHPDADFGQSDVEPPDERADREVVFGERFDFGFGFGDGRGGGGGSFRGDGGHGGLFWMRGGIVLGEWEKGKLGEDISLRPSRKGKLRHSRRGKICME
jgi:hypothetical protein